MTPSTDGSHVDLKGIFWRTFFLIFLVRELVVWSWLQRIPFRDPFRRVVIFLVSRRATRASLAWALVGGGAVAILAFLIDSLIVGPLLKRWLCPVVDSSSLLFHLAAGEPVVASTPARRHAGGGWKPGTLVLTDRRLWFIPAGWHDEPWSLNFKEIDRVEPLPAFLARVAPIRNWPEHLRFRTRSDEETTFAMANPSTVLAWFYPPVQSGAELIPATKPRQGAFDV